MQMDQLMHKCEDHEDLLVLLVTHRGVMYLHNLVTAIQMLQVFAEKDLAKRIEPDREDLYAGYHEVFSSSGTKGETIRSSKDRGIVAEGDSADYNNSVDNSTNSVASDFKNVEGTTSVVSSDHISVEDAASGVSTGNTTICAMTPTQIDIVNRAKEHILVHFENPANQHYLQCRNHSLPVKDMIVRDERFELLLCDIYENRNRLDVEGACQVIIALNTLEHRNARIYNGILRHLMRVQLYDVADDSMSSFGDSIDHTTNGNITSCATAQVLKERGRLLLKACQCYVKAGYYDIPLYSKVCRELYRRYIETVGTEVKLGHEVDKELIVETLRLFAKVEVYDPVVFREVARVVKGTSLEPRDLVDVAVAFAAHRNCNKIHDDVMVWVAGEVGHQLSDFTTLEVAKCVHAFARLGLYFESVYNEVTRRLIEELQGCTSSCATSSLSIRQMGLIVLDIANYSPKVGSTARLVQMLLGYLEEHIDLVTEKTAINVVFAMCAADLRDMNRYMLAFLLRKIGSGTEWEQCKYKVFAIWLYYIVNLPELAGYIPMRCVTAGMREWLLRHGNGTQFRQELLEIAELLQRELGVTQIDMDATGMEITAGDIIDTLSSIDLQMDGEMHKIVINEACCRNDVQRVVGVDLVTQNLLKKSGAQVHSINFHYWRSMGRSEKVRYIRSLLYSSG
ncbi:Streptococcus pyogenes, putative [Babesia ovis]|uniref:Streptococcus pyogenes, putative n=1 Tax=Babesia ovis TaxID=5869 RepID=A0A9W5WVU6_BABOV|nr:Streptococcus pyogenes, putative [Babesia ovis]